MRFVFSSFFLVLTLLNLGAQEQSMEFETPFSGLKASGNMHLILFESLVQKVVFWQEEGGETIDVAMNNGVLELRTKSEIATNSKAIKTELYYTGLSSLEILKGAQVQSADTLVSGTLTLEVVTGAKVELMIHVDSLSARVNQGADIILYGITHSQLIHAYTWGNFLGTDLYARYTYIKAATGAQVKIRTSRLLEANATSKAFVAYVNEPSEKKVKTSVGGEITLLSE